MANRVKCPSCGTEFDIQNEKEWNGYHSCGASIPDMDMCVGTLIPSEKQTNKTANKGETKMANKGTTMEEIMAMVMENQKQMTQMMVAIADKGERSASVSVSSGDKGDGLGKTSGYYNKELCGYMWNPYLDRRFLPDTFRDWMKKYNLNIDLAIKNEVDLMDSIMFSIEECKRLATMQKTSPIAFAERSKMWTEDMMKKVFIKYWKLVLSDIDKAIEAGKDYFLENKHLHYIKYRGKKIPATVSEVVNNNNSARPRMNIQINCYEETTDKYGRKVKTEWKLPLDINATLRKLEKAGTYKDLYCIMSTSELIHLPNAFIRKYVWGDEIVTHIKEKPGYHDNRLADEFIEGYKKSGAYFTMQHDIKHKGLVVKGLRDREAMAYTKSLTDLPAYKIYKIYKVALGYSAENGRN